MKMGKSIRCAVTGAKGYVGSCIVNYLRKNGLVVYEMGRSSKESTPKKYFIPFSLEKEVSQRIFRNVDVLIHCAWDFKQIEWEDIRKVNVEGSLRLFKAAKKAGVKKIIFISTMSAFDGCKSLYGKAKLEVEIQSRKLGVISIRPGLVYDAQAKGMVGALQRLVSISTVLPIVARNQILYLCHSEDLSRLVLKLTKTKANILKPIVAANENGLTLKQILRKLAEAKGKKPVFIPVPSWVVLVALKIVEKLGIKLRIKSDSLTGLLYADTNPDFTETRKTGVKFREFKVH